MSKIQKNYFEVILKRLFRLGLTLLIVFLSISLARKIFRAFEAKRQVEEVASSLQNLENENKVLEEDLKLIQSNESVEARARQSLGLVQEGEIIIILPDEATLKSYSPRKMEEEEVPTITPNWQKWAEIFAL